MKKLGIPKLSLYEKIWFILFTGAGVVLSVIWGDTIIGFTAFISGIICVLLAAKGSKWNYVVGIINCLTYSWVCYQVGLFGDVIENMAFYLPLQIVGFYFWGKKTMDDGIVEMKKMKRIHFVIVILVSAIVVLAFGYFLSTLERQVNPYIDSFTNVYTVIAALLMLKRFREYWMLYIIVNAVTVMLWVIRLIEGSPDSVTVLIMWAAYLVNSIYGAIVWYNGTKEAIVDEL